MTVFADSYRGAIRGYEGEEFAKAGVAGFVESTARDFQVFQQEDRQASESLNMSEKFRQRAEVIRELGETVIEPAPAPRSRAAVIRGVADAESTAEAQRVRIADLAARYPEVKTDDELELEVIEESRVLRETRDRELRQQAPMGHVGSFVGMMGASLTDPINAAMLLFGAPVKAGLVAKVGIETALGAGIETAIQPQVANYKAKLGVEYGLSEAVTNILAAGGGAGVLTGTVGLVAKLVGRIEGLKRVPSRTVAQEDALNVMQDQLDVIKDNPGDLKSEAAAAAHYEAVTRAVGQTFNDVPVNVDDIRARLAPAVERSDVTGLGTENQRLSGFVKAEGGVSVAQAGALRGEFAALREVGDKSRRVVKAKAGASPDAMAQAAFDAGFIDDTDPATLADALRRDLEGEPITSIQGTRAERALELEIDRELNAYVEMKEEEAARMAMDRADDLPEFVPESAADAKLRAEAEREFDVWTGRDNLPPPDEAALRASRELEAEDVQIPIEDTNVDGKVDVRMGSAREAMGNADMDVEAAVNLKNCLLG